MGILLPILAIATAVAVTTIILFGYAVCKRVASHFENQKQKKATREEVRLAEIRANEAREEREHQERMAALRAVGIDEGEAEDILGGTSERRVEDDLHH